MSQSFSKAKNKPKSFAAQGTIEYLVIIGVVIVISLMVVALATNFLGSASGTAQSAQKAALWSQSLAVTETAVTTDGNFLVRIVNNSGGPVTISRIQLNDDTPVDFSVSNSLNWNPGSDIFRYSNKVSKYLRF